ncbi:Stk1 family PASTA domain-containing Ser/Thr kinase [Nocardioides daphniae]|nr:Stk1 family PASTA domain-containing Ser/Thr kinase [Nocardioides daphniae]
MSEPTTVGGRYELGELLGRGGMAEVRKGVDTRLGRTVAVKRLRTDLASDATFQARFRREAQSSASLNHPAIVSVYDTGEEWSDAADGGVAQPYIVMEYVAGRTLREILREGRKILPERALEITSGVLAALDYSHRAGIIHRDIKPANVMLTPSGDVKVMDFGIARAVSDASSTMTQTAAVVGTAQYLSPEQARGETVDSRSDVYSTGCLLYELLTGRPPFVGESPVSVAYQHVREPVTPPSEIDADLPPEIDAIVLKALAKRVEDRYQSAAAMRQDIERYLAGQAVFVAPTPQPPATGQTAVATPAVQAALGDDRTATRTAAKDNRRERSGLFLLILGLLVVLITAAVFVLPRIFESADDQVRVPNLIGMTEAEAREAIGEAELKVGRVDYEANEDAPADEVTSQDPSAIYVDPGSTVNIVVSTGAPMVEVPFLIGQDRKSAREVLEDRGLEVRFQTAESDEPVNQVVRTDPAAYKEVPEGTVVTLFVSDGPEKIPDVVGLTQQEATDALTKAGFTVDVFETGETTEPKGTVIRQSPVAGREAPSETTVTIFVSTYEAPTPPSTSPTPSQTPTPDGTPPGVPPGLTRP